MRDLADQSSTMLGVVVIVVTNAMTLGFALWSKGGLLALMWPYWLQSVLVGVFAWWRMRAARLRSGSRPPASDRFIGTFFFAHAIYLLFLALLTWLADADGLLLGTSNGVESHTHVGRIEPLDGLWFCGLAAAFAWTLIVEYGHQIEADRHVVPRPETIASAAFLRVLPIHLTLALGFAFGGGTFALIVFATLKTAVDIRAHRRVMRPLGDDPAGTG